MSSVTRSPSDSNAWSHEEGPHNLRMLYRGRHGGQLVTTLRPWLEAYGAHLDQFHWQKHDPHITFQLQINERLETEFETFLTDLSTALSADT